MQKASFAYVDEASRFMFCFTWGHLSRYRLRRVLVEAMSRTAQNKDQQWSGERKI